MNGGSVVDDLMRRASEYVDEPASSVKLGEGETFMGGVERYETIEGSYGPCPVARIRNEAGQLWTMWLSTMSLVAEFQRIRPTVGERIAVRRLSDGSNAQGTSFKRFRLFVDRVEGPDAGLDILDQAVAEMGLDETKESRPELFEQNGAEAGDLSKFENAELDSDELPF